MGRGVFRFLALAALLAACVDKQQAPCDPADDASCSIVKGNPCHVDSDCGDGRCVNGTCG